MIKETAAIVRVEPDCLWVEGIQHSACGPCSARAGCGQRLLNGAIVRQPLIRVLRNADDGVQYCIGEDVEVCVPEEVVVKGSLLVYFCPLLGLLLAAGLADSVYSQDWMTICAAAIGLVIGGGFVRVISAFLRDKSHFQPVVAETNPRKFVR